MAYVNVPKDLTKVKTKLAFNLTKRQLIMKRTVSRWRSSSATSTACVSRGRSSARIRPTISMPLWSGKTS